MADNGFTVEVPITLKGGREGDKVGKQIGDKIAVALEKSLKSVGFGKTKSSASAGGKSGANTGSFFGMSKGIGKMVTKLGVIGIIAGSALKLMKKSSGYLKGVMSIFGRAFLIFFRPFGDFLASLLRPLAMILMKAAVRWLKFTRSDTVKGARKGAQVAGIPGAVIGGTAATIAPGFDWNKWIVGKLGSIGDWKVNIGVWLLEKFNSIWTWTFNIGTWLSDKIKGIWNYTGDFGGWLWERLKSVWDYTANFGSWLWEQLKKIWNVTIDFGGWLWEKITSIWNWSWDVGAWLKSKIISIFSSNSSSGSSGSSSGGSSSGGSSSSGSSGSSSGGSSFIGPIQYSSPSPSSTGGAVSKFVKSLIPKGIRNLIGLQTGKAFVSETGMYQLHRGESVVPRVQNNNNSASSIVLKPTIQIMGNNSNIDADEIARRFSSMTMMELKSRGMA